MPNQHPHPPRQWLHIINILKCSSVLFCAFPRLTLAFKFLVKVKVDWVLQTSFSLFRFVRSMLLPLSISNMLDRESHIMVMIVAIRLIVLVKVDFVKLERPIQTWQDSQLYSDGIVTQTTVRKEIRKQLWEKRKERRKQLWEKRKQRRKTVRKRKEKTTVRRKRKEWSKQVWENLFWQVFSISRKQSRF